MKNIFKEVMITILWLTVIGLGAKVATNDFGPLLNVLNWLGGGLLIHVGVAKLVFRRIALEEMKSNLCKLFGG